MPDDRELGELGIITTLLTVVYTTKCHNSNGALVLVSKIKVNASDEYLVFAFVNLAMIPSVIVIVIFGARICQISGALTRSGKVLLQVPF